MSLKKYAPHLQLTFHNQPKIYHFLLRISLVLSITTCMLYKHTDIVVLIAV